MLCHHSWDLTLLANDNNSTKGCPALLDVHLGPEKVFELGPVYSNPLSNP